MSADDCHDVRASDGVGLQPRGNHLCSLPGRQKTSARQRGDVLYVTALTLMVYCVCGAVFRKKHYTDSTSHFVRLYAQLRTCMSVSWCILVQVLLRFVQMLSRNRCLVCSAIAVNWLFGYLSAIALYVKDEEPGK